MAVTHSPQIAAMANQQWRIAKSVTVTQRDLCAGPRSRCAQRRNRSHAGRCEITDAARAAADNYWMAKFRKLHERLRDIPADQLSELEAIGGLHWQEKLPSRQYYHQEDAPVISDAAYDALQPQSAIEAAFPHLSARIVPQTASVRPRQRAFQGGTYQTDAVSWKCLQRVRPE